MEAFQKLKSDSGSANVSLVPRRKDMKKQLDQLKSQGLAKFCVFRGDPADNLEVKNLD